MVQGTLLWITGTHKIKQYLNCCIFSEGREKEDAGRLEKAYFEFYRSKSRCPVAVTQPEGEKSHDAP